MTGDRIEAHDIELAFESSIGPLTDKDRFANEVAVIFQPLSGQILKMIGH